ncbi:MAG: tetratricopeptide repeat protein [Planctomycetes bacterium]|nr:tetratricopeptide repeat protein [Planctomycetota bacterium]MBL7144310.1 tetratricopeptide repeat protein [Phycisphaerae bacterium]
MQPPKKIDWASVNIIADRKAFNSMKSRLFIRSRTLIAAVVFVVLCSSVSRPIENPAIFNPSSYSTVPPSSYQSGQFNNPQAPDMDGNLLITGNVRRGMHFRDTVPYGSTMSFRGDLGSSSLSSFLRDSAGAEDIGYSANRYSVQPYYLQSQTVATTRPGYSGVLGQAEANLNNRRMQSGFTTGAYVSDSQMQNLPDGNTLASDVMLQGTQTQDSVPVEPRIVNSIRELQLLTQQARSNVSAKDQPLMVERYQEQKQETGDKIRETGISFETGFTTGLENKQSSIEKYNSLEQSWTTERAQTAVPDFGTDKPGPKPTLAEAYAQANAMTFQDSSAFQQDISQLLQTDETISAGSDIDVQDKGDIVTSDIIEQVKRQLEDLINSVDKKEGQGTGHTSEKTRTNTGLSSGGLSRVESSFNPAESAIDSLDNLKGLSQADLFAKAKSIREPQTNPDTFSMTRFNNHFQEAQEHLKGGRYYAAADSFALASIYKPDEPLCLAGRGHALLAAGEYISSALFLTRAIEAKPEYVKTKIDLAAMLGGENKLESRIADIQEWLGRSGSGKLEFLLGYVYYRIGRLGPAQQAIDTAYVKIPQSAAVVAVKNAVDDAIAGR